VHRLDTGNLAGRAVEGAPAGSVLHAIAEEGPPIRAVAEAIGRGLDVPVVSVPAEQASDPFGWLAHFFGTDSRASNALTRELLASSSSTEGCCEDPSKVDSRPTVLGRLDPFELSRSSACRATYTV
jgi:hypothetical protein